MKTSQVGRALIEKYEGLILGAYDDANDHIVKPGDPVRGVLTIGYGHTNAAGAPKVLPGQKITKEQADQILASDLGKVETNVSNLVKVPLNQNQFDALVSFQFNTGALGKSSALRKLNDKDYVGAATALTLYNKAGQIAAGPIPGLVRRREEEKALFLKPAVSTAPANVTAGGAVVGGATALTQTEPSVWPYIIVGTVVLAIVGWVVVHWYNKRLSAEKEFTGATGFQG